MSSHTICPGVKRRPSQGRRGLAFGHELQARAMRGGKRGLVALPRPD